MTNNLIAPTHRTVHMLALKSKQKLLNWEVTNIWTPAEYQRCLSENVDTLSLIPVTKWLITVHDPHENMLKQPSFLWESPCPDISKVPPGDPLLGRVGRKQLGPDPTDHPSDSWTLKSSWLGDAAVDIYTCVCVCLYCICAVMHLFNYLSNRTFIHTTSYLFISLFCIRARIVFSDFSYTHSDTNS